MLYIFLLIFFILSIMAILFIPINVIISYSEKLSFSIIILGVKISLPFNRKKKKRKKEKSNSESAKKKSEKGSKNTFSFSMDIFKIGEKAIIKIVKDLNIKEITLYVKVTGADAAHTALLFGKISSIVYTFCGILISQAQPKNYNVNVSPDFLGSKTTVYFNLRFSGRIFHTLKSLLYFIKEYNQIKNK